MKNKFPCVSPFQCRVRARRCPPGPGQRSDVPARARSERPDGTTGTTGTEVPEGGNVAGSHGGSWGKWPPLPSLFWLLVPYARQRLLEEWGGSGSPPSEGGSFLPRKIHCPQGRSAAPALGTGVPESVEKFAAQFWGQRKKPLGWPGGSRVKASGAAGPIQVSGL